MARNINVELLGGNVCTLAVRPDMTIRELKEEVKAFHPSEDEITRILSTVEFFLHGEKLNDLQTTVSESILDSANMQVIFYVKPAIQCVNRYGHMVAELHDVRIPSTQAFIGPQAFAGCHCLLRLVIPESVTDIGDFAFAVCTSLTSLTIPKSVTQIGDSAFEGCSSLMSLTIPHSVRKIGLVFEKFAASRSLCFSAASRNVSDPTLPQASPFTETSEMIQIYRFVWK